MLIFLCNPSIVITNCFYVHAKEEEEDGGSGEGGFRWWGKGKDQKGIDR
jgi:hypothetical protein